MTRTNWAVIVPVLSYSDRVTVPPVWAPDSMPLPATASADASSRLSASITPPKAAVRYVVPPVASPPRPLTLSPPIALVETNIVPVPGMDGQRVGIDPGQIFAVVAIGRAAIAGRAVAAGGHGSDVNGVVGRNGAAVRLAIAIGIDLGIAAVSVAAGQAVATRRVGTQRDVVTGTHIDGARHARATPRPHEPFRQCRRSRCRPARRKGSRYRPLQRFSPSHPNTGRRAAPGVAAGGDAVAARAAVSDHHRAGLKRAID